MDENNNKEKSPQKQEEPASKAKKAAVDAPKDEAASKKVKPAPPASDAKPEVAPQGKQKPAKVKKKRSGKYPDNTECQNCGATLTGDYCHECGQAAKEPRRLVIGLVQDVVVDTLAIDGKLARTLGLLLSRPGRLARRYLDGKRVRYSPPFRLYLFASVFFFFAAFWMVDASKVSLFDDDEPVDPATLEEAQAEIDAAQEEIRDAIGQTNPEIADDLNQALSEAVEAAPDDSNDHDNTDAAAEGEDDPDVPFKDKKWADVDFNGPDWLEPHAKRFFEAAQRAVEDPRLFIAEIRENVPRFLLLAPLIYGLTLTLLYFYRRKFFIFDHFIVSLYMHAALYAYLLLALLISRIPVIGFLWFLPLVWGVFQPIIVLRQVYRSNWFSVWIKWFVSMMIYLIAFALIITLGLSYSLYQS